MKTKFLAIAALAASVAFTSCNKNNEGGNPEAGNQIIAVKLPADMVTRAVEAPVANGTAATTFSNINVFLLNGNSIVKKDVFTPTEITNKTKYFEDISSTVNRVIVVVDAPAAARTSFAAVGTTTASQILNYAYDAASQNASTGLDTKTLVGDATNLATKPLPAGFPNEATHTGHTYKEAEVTMNALTARLEVGAVKAGEGITNIQLVAVYVNNYFPTSVATAATLNAHDNTVWESTAGYPGAAAYTGAAPKAYTEAVYKNLNNVTVTPGAAMCYAFHVFPGNLPHVIMLVKGEYATGYYEGANKHFLGYVTFNKYNLGGATYLAATQANKIYKMGLDANGIEIKASMVTPEPEMDSYDLGAVIKITTWDAVNVTPEI